MPFIILTPNRPLVHHYALPPEDDLDKTYVLVFDTTPEGYRKAYAWLEKNLDRLAEDKVNVYRLVIPCCDRANDLSEYVLLPEPKPTFRGTVDAYPPSHKFAIQKIVLDRDELKTLQSKVTLCYPAWPIQDFTCTLSNIWISGFCSERHLYLPNLYTGLTAIQLYMLQTCEENRFSFAEITTLAAKHFKVDENLVATQLFALTQGSYPFLLNTHYLASHIVKVRPGYENPLLPPYALNGSLPCAIEPIFHLFVFMLKTEKHFPKDNVHLIPECAPFAFSHSRDVWHTNATVDKETGIVEPPYGVTKQDYFRKLQKDNPDIDIECTWKGIYIPIKAERNYVKLDSIEIQPNWTFWDDRNDKVVTFENIKFYLIAWKYVKEDYGVEDLKQYLHERACLLEERKFLRDIYVNVKFVNEYGQRRRCYYDENARQKRIRLAQVHGKQYVDHLWNVPIRKVGTSCLDVFDEEAEDGVTYNNDDEEDDEGQKVLARYPLMDSGRSLWVYRLEQACETLGISDETVAWMKGL
jgi:hypothetical protein